MAAGFYAQDTYFSATSHANVMQWDTVGDGTGNRIPASMTRDAAGNTMPVGDIAGRAPFFQIADGGVVTIGANADAIVAAGAAGTLSAKLRRATQGLEDLKSLLVLAAGANLIGKVGLDQTTPGTTNKVYLTDISAAKYQTIAASQTNTALTGGGGGATGDYLAGVLIVPATTSPGAVSIKDGAGTAVTIFAGGASSVGSLVPFFVPLGIKSTGGAWGVATGANVSVIAAGNFT
jgi:hypothetical protein